MSIGLNVRDHAGLDEYWPYLTQRHLTGLLWPLAKKLGLSRVELMEVLCIYRDRDEVQAFMDELAALLDVLRGEGAPVYFDTDHVVRRSLELLDRLGW